jgi:hypothetical protein
MSECERDSEVIEVDNDITTPGASKQTNRTVSDRWIKKPSVCQEEYKKTYLEFFRCNLGLVSVILYL